MFKCKDQMVNLAKGPSLCLRAFVHAAMSAHPIFLSIPLQGQPWSPNRSQSLPGGVTHPVPYLHKVLCMFFMMALDTKGHSLHM